tara:strand:- start:39990 stop:40313 length:324 start_codon:yes stop_codon:yes gene_type:complete
LSDSEFTCPQNREEVINTYFMEHRAKLIDVAAYLDRLDRARPVSEEADFRDVAFRNAIAILTDGESQRARRILDLFSDHTTEIPQSAEGMKGALGAPVAATSEGGAV